MSSMNPASRGPTAAGFYFYKQDHVTIETPTLPKVEILIGAAGAIPAFPHIPVNTP
jgi:hypothetical protein